LCFEHSHVITCHYQQVSIAPSCVHIELTLAQSGFCGKNPAGRWVKKPGCYWLTTCDVVAVVSSWLHHRGYGPSLTAPAPAEQDQEPNAWHRSLHQPLIALLAPCTPLCQEDIIYDIDDLQNDFQDPENVRLDRAVHALRDGTPRSTTTLSRFWRVWCFRKGARRRRRTGSILWPASCWKRTEQCFCARYGLRSRCCTRRGMSARGTRLTLLRIPSLPKKRRPQHPRYRSGYYEIIYPSTPPGRLSRLAPSSVRWTPEVLDGLPNHSYNECCFCGLRRQAWCRLTESSRHRNSCRSACPTVFPFAQLFRQARFIAERSSGLARSAF
jgi:hypothetical protein